MADNRSFSRLLWPEIDDFASAKEAANLGALGCIVVALYLAGTLVYRVTKYGPAANPDGLLGYADAAVFLVCALGVWYRWRSAAIIAALLFAISVALSIATNGIRGIGILGIVVAAFLVSGVRGSFAVRRFAPEGTSSGATDA